MSAIHNKRSTPDKDRERMKELDRMRRHEMHTTMKKEPIDNAPLFGNPVKVAKPIDDMSKMIHNTLGSYETVKDQLTERSNYLLLGIPKQPPTPVVGKGNDEIFTVPSGVTHNGTDKAMMPGHCSAATSVKMKTETKPKTADHKASRKKSHRPSERKLSVDKNKVKKHNASHHISSASETNTTLAHIDNKHSSDSAKRKDDKSSSLLSSHTVSPPRTEHSHSSGNRLDTEPFMKSPKESTPIKKEDGFPPPYPRPSLFAQMTPEMAKVISPLKDLVNCDNDSSKLSTPSPANTAKPSESTTKTTFNGVIVESESRKSDINYRQGRTDKASIKKTLPPLKLPQLDDSLNNHQIEGIQCEVETILKEMTNPIDPLLTAIQTPSKGGEPAKFPFPAQQGKESHVSQLFTHTKTTEHSIAVKPNKMVPSTETQAHDLSADLLISDDDSEDEKAVEGRHTVTETTTTAMRHSPATRPRSPSSSNSGSSSSESEDESSSGSDSDSESSSSDNASPSPSPLQKERKWCLAPFFSAAAVQKTKASPGSASQNNKYHPKPGIISSNSSNREAVSAPRNSPSKLLECGDSSNGFDTRDFSDTEQQGFDPGGGLNDLDQVEKNKPNGLIKLKVKVPSKTISKGKSPGKASTSKSNVKSAANKSGKKMSSIKKSSVEKAAEGGCGSKTTPVKGKTKDSKGKTNKQTTKSHEKKTDVKPKTPKQSTPRSDKPSTPKQSDKKSKKPTASSTKGEKYYKSKAFVSDDSDSDSDASIDVVNTSSPDKSLQNTSIKSLSSSSSSSLTMTPSHTKCSKSTTPSKTKTKDKSSSGKKSSEKAKVEINTGLKVVISEIGKDVALPEPLLSPIQNEDFRHMPTLTPTKPFLSSSACQQLSKIEYVNGIPSLVVKLDLSLIAKVPTKVSVKKEIEESTSFSGNPPIITSSAVEEKPPKLKKIPKRKQEQRKDDKPDCATETKKIKKEHDIISKSPTIEKPEPENKEIGVKAEDSHEWDRKHPRRLSERRSSNTSIQSTNSVKKEKDSPPRKKTKRDHSIGDTKHDNKLKRRDWDTPEIRTITSESPKAVGLTSAHQSNGHKAGNDWSAIAGGVHLDGPERRHQERKPIKTEFDETQYPADHYCAEAKELKHAADVQVDKIAKALTYVDAVLSFIKCSNAIETDSESRSSPFNMYSETSDLIKYIMRYTVNHGLDTGGIDKKLAVLCMRCQALLCNKMFKLKKDNAMKFSKILTDHFKTPTKPTNAQAPSPYQPNWNAKSTTGTPSPMSPTPSPAGSIGSVGSLSSNNGDGYLSVTQASSARMTNGMATPSAAHATVTIPQRIHTIMQQQTVYTNYLLSSHDLWEQADELQKENEEFFRGLDIECGHLTFHSSILDLVRYVRLGLHRLRSIATGL